MENTDSVFFSRTTGPFQTDFAHTNSILMHKDSRFDQMKDSPIKIKTAPLNNLHILWASQWKSSLVADYLLFSVPQESISFIWKHHCLWRATKNLDLCLYIISMLAVTQGIGYLQFHLKLSSFSLVVSFNDKQGVTENLRLPICETKFTFICTQTMILFSCKE